MAKKVTITGTNKLSSLNDAWGGVNSGNSAQTIHGTSVPAGAEWGMNREEVERFVKEQFGTKFGDFRWQRPQDSNYYYLLVFATKADATAWDGDNTLTNYIQRLQLPISAVQSDSYTATLSTSRTGSSAGTPFLIKRGENWNVPVRLNAWHIIAATSTQDPIAATVQLKVERSTDGVNWTQVRTATISTSEGTTGYPNSINVGKDLDTGQDAQYQLKISVEAIPYTDNEGNPATMGAQPVIIHVKTVTLSVSMPDSVWQLAKYVNSGALTVPELSFVLSGAVSKTLHVQMTNTAGSVTFEHDYENISAIGTYGVSPYDSTGTMGITNSGVHEIRAWLTCDDNAGGELVSDTIIHQIMIVNAGQQAAALLKKVLVQGMAVSVDNFVQAVICNYMVWNPKLVDGNVQNDTSESVEVKFLVADGNNLSETYTTYLAQPVTTTPGEKMSLMGTMEVESDTVSDSYNAYLHALDSQDNSLLQQPLFLTIDNTAGFQPVGGAVFQINPKTRNNGEQNPQTILNARSNNAVVQSTWTGFKMDDSDGYVADSEGNKVLRVPAGRQIVIGYNPLGYFYTAPQASKSMTIDVAFKVHNVTNEDDPIFRIAEYLNESDYWLGLLLRPMDGTMVSVLSGGTAGETDFRWAEDRMQHLSVTIIPYVQPNEFGDSSYNARDAENAQNTINLVRVYLNGVIVRELRYTPGNASEFCTGAMSNGGIIIGQTGTNGRASGADIDIYGMRVWQSGLKPMQVLQNYISALPSSTEKRKVKAQNDILFDDNTGRLSLAKCKEVGKNVIVWHGDMPLIDDDSKKGWAEVYRYDSDGNYLPEYSGTFCKSSKNLKAKGQGTTAMTYYYWNMQMKLQDVTDTIELTPSQLHSSIVLGTPVEEDGSYSVPIYGGCLGTDFPVGNGTKSYPCTVDGSGNVATVTLPDGWIDGNGKYRGQCWQNGANRPLSQKLVLKINYASSMQSHLIGVNWLYNALHTAICGENSLQAGTPAAYKAQVAKQVEPVLLFTAGKDITDVSTTEGSAIYQGPGGFGPGKMDKPTWGYSSKYSGHSYFGMFEGAANNTILSDFLAPWDDTDHLDANDNVIQRAKVKYFLQDPVSPGVAKDPESFYYRHTVLREVEEDGETVVREFDQWEKCIGFDSGKTGRSQSDGLLFNSNSCDNPEEAPKANITGVIRNAWNYVYLHNPNINLYRGTFTDFQNETFTDAQLRQKWVCRANATDNDNYLLKRYDFCERRWVNAGLWNTSTHAYDAIDIREYEGMNWSSMTSAQQADHAAVLAKFKQLLIEDAYPTDNHAGIGAYFKASSLKFHYAFINLFIAGTDNCSKNTYYVIDPSTHLIELHQDDVDTVLATDNYGYQTKPYYIDRKHPYPDGSSISGYDGMQNGLFDLVEALWLDDSSHTIATMLGQVLSSMASLAGGLGSVESDAMNGVWKSLNRYLFDIQRYIPKAAYNEAARIRYEFPAAIGYTGRDGQARPLAQSMGDQLEAEIQFLKRRLIYMASYAGFGEFSPSIGSGRQSIGISDVNTTFSIPVTALPNGDAPVYTFKVKPHQYLYPCFYKESTQFLTYHRTAPGEEYEYSINGLSANDYPIVMPALNYYRSIGNVGNMSGAGANFRLELAGSRLTEFKAEPTLYYPASGSAITAEAWEALSASDKANYLPAFRPVSASIPDSYGATRVREMSLKGCSTIVHSAAVPLDLKKMSMVESIDLRYITAASVNLPETQTLTSLQLQKSLASLVLTAQPNLATLTLQGYANLTQMIITGSPLLGSTMRIHVLSLIEASANVSVLKLAGINWMTDKVDGDVIRWLLGVGDSGTCELAGSIDLVSGATGILYYEDVAKLIMRYGNIRSTDNGLYVHFAGISISASAISIEGKKYINTDPTSADYDLDLSDNFNDLALLVASGNDVAVATNGAGKAVPNVVWELVESGASAYAEFADPYSPVLHFKQKGLAVKDKTLTVRVTLTNTNNETRVCEKLIGLWNRIPEVGDYAWTDGQFDNTNDASKKLAGVVIRKTERQENDKTVYDLEILSAADTSFPSSLVSSGYESSWGLYPAAANGFSDGKTNGEYDDPVMNAILQAVQNWTKPDGITYANENSFKTDIFDTPLKNMSGDAYIRKDADAVTAAGGGIAMQDATAVANNGYATYTQNYMNNFDTKEENAVLMSYADAVLKAALQVLNITQEDFPAGCTSEGIPTTTTALYNLAELIVQKATDAGATTPSRYRELLYPAARRCNVWCPADISGALIDETKLHDSYKRGKWMLPSSGLLARIFNFMANSRAAYNTSSAPSADYANEDVALEAQLPLFANAIARGRSVPISSGSYHWSSTEYYRTNARYVNFYSGYTDHTGKYNSNVVRPVTAFKFVP